MKICNLPAAIDYKEIHLFAKYVQMTGAHLVSLPTWTWFRHHQEKIVTALLRGKQEEACLCGKALREDFTDALHVLDLTEKCGETVTQEFERYGTIIGHLHLHAWDADMERELSLITAQASALLFAAFLRREGMKAVWLDAREFMPFGQDGYPDLKALRKNEDELDKDTTYVLATGFGHNPMKCHEEFHGGNEVYAAYLAAACRGELCIRQQEDSLETVGHEPMYCPKTHYTLTYDDADRLVHNGIQLVSPACIEVAREFHIPVSLTRGGDDMQAWMQIDDSHPDTPLRCVAGHRDVSYIRVRSLGTVTAFRFIQKVLAVFADCKVDILLMTSSNLNVSVAVKRDETAFRKIQEALASFAETSIEAAASVISIIGQLSDTHTSIEQQAIDLLKDIPILMISYGSDSRCVSIVLREDDLRKALGILAEACLKIPQTVGNHSPYAGFID